MLCAMNRDDPSEAPGWLLQAINSPATGGTKEILPEQSVCFQASSDSITGVRGSSLE